MRKPVWSLFLGILFSCFVAHAQNNKTGNAGAQKPATPKLQGQNTNTNRNAPSEDNPDDYPPDTTGGKCYAKSVIPDKYEYREEQVVDKPAYTYTKKIPGVYTTVMDTVVVRPAQSKIVVVPAKYEYISDSELVSKATKRWVGTQSDKNCLSPDPKDCRVWTLKSIPAVYRKVTRKVEIKPITTEEILLPPITSVLPRRKTVEPPREEKIEVPATYKTVTNKALVKKGSKVWKEVLCDQNITGDVISEIYSALKLNRYDPGTDGRQITPKMKEALMKFQMDNDLPLGSLNIETLVTLGVNF